MTNKELTEFLKQYPEDAEVGILAAWPERNAALRHNGLFIFGGKGAPILGLEVNGQTPLENKATRALDAMHEGRGVTLQDLMLGEDKKEICDWLAATLIHTRQYRDLVCITYEKNEETREETATVRFENGEKKVNVAADSGAAMIRDIMNAII